MLRSALLCSALACAGYGSAAWLTHDFQVWTAEGARRLEVALSPIPVPAAQVEGPGITPQALSSLVAGGHAVTIVDFVYTRCQTVCLALGSVYQRMQQSLLIDGDKNRVKLLSISFDGTHDDSGVLQKYAEQMGANPKVWRFVRVQTSAETEHLLAAFQVVVVPSGSGDFEHNAALLVINPQGQLVRVFDYADQQLALDYAKDLAKRLVP
jgi:protein SCO1/2